ncbi:MAG: hypothetical protein WCT24_00765 [Patescibacteria group bacterium]
MLPFPVANTDWQHHLPPSADEGGMMESQEGRVWKYYSAKRKLHEQMMSLEGTREVEVPDILILEADASQILVTFVTWIMDQSGSADIKIPVSGMVRHLGTPIVVHCGFLMQWPVDALDEWVETSIELNAFHKRRVVQRARAFKEGSITPNLMQIVVDTDADYCDQNEFMTQVVTLLQERYKNA